MDVSCLECCTDQLTQSSPIRRLLGRRFLLGLGTTRGSSLRSPMLVLDASVAAVARVPVTVDDVAVLGVSIVVVVLVPVAVAVAVSRVAVAIVGALTISTPSIADILDILNFNLRLCLNEGTQMTKIRIHIHVPKHNVWITLHSPWHIAETSCSR